MTDTYILMVASLGVLAILDLVVGVSNDAVNFLNSAIGSKAFPFKTILIIAGIGIAFGAFFSSGMMEVARKGIFMPSEFYFNEIMMIFVAVMITDVILLDFFNTFSMPTSTTVSIVFELLGAAVSMAIIKTVIDHEGIENISKYINTEKASQIILGIFLSVIIAFTIGAIVQFISRLILSFKFNEKPLSFHIFFGATALTSIIYFLFIKGFKGLTFISKAQMDFVLNNTLLIIGLCFVATIISSYFFVIVFRRNVFRLVVLVGTFSLAVAFAGNDLVNFIGVPIAAWNSYRYWSESGIAPESFSMEVLNSELSTPLGFLVICGLVMVITLWLSKKARSVTETEIKLAHQGHAKERFKPNLVSKTVVGSGVFLKDVIVKVIPKRTLEQINQSFLKPKIILPKGKSIDIPAFDMIRASVNLMVSSILISVATSMKLPLSTTYVTFMVAMGTSFADRAWGQDSAVYRVAGVFNVIGGWFLTAIIAFTTSGIFLYFIYLGGGTSISILLMLSLFLLTKNFRRFRNKTKKIKQEEELSESESHSVMGVIDESASNISKVITRSKAIHNHNAEGLSVQNVSQLKKNRSRVVKLNHEISNLRENIFFFIKNLEETSNKVSKFYILLLSHLQDIVNSLKHISEFSYEHTSNKHKKLTFNQINDLIEIDNNFKQLFSETSLSFKTKSFSVESTNKIKTLQESTLKLIDQKIEIQIERTRNNESSPKNTSLYFNTLIETRDVVVSAMKLLELYSGGYKNIDN